MLLFQFHWHFAERSQLSPHGIFIIKIKKTYKFWNILVEKNCKNYRKRSEIVATSAKSLFHSTKSPRFKKQKQRYSYTTVLAWNFVTEAAIPVSERPFRTFRNHFSQTMITLIICSMVRTYSMFKKPENDETLVISIRRKKLIQNQRYNTIKVCLL